MSKSSAINGRVGRLRTSKHCAEMVRRLVDITPDSQAMVVSIMAASLARREIYLRNAWMCGMGFVHCVAFVPSPRTIQSAA